MKIHLKSRGSRASVLLISLVASVLLILALFSYLNIVEWQNMSMYRSEAWNNSLATAEAGVEEALAQLNPGATAPAVNIAANGWGGSGGSYGPMVRSFTNGANIATYTVTITNDAFPVIQASGSLTIAKLRSTVTRTVLVKTAPIPLFSVAVAAKEGITLNGSKIFTDSFNSTNASYSSNGLYNVALATTNGDVATLTGLLSIGNNTINGNLYLGSSATNGANPGGSISGIIYYDYNYQFSDVKLPNNVNTWLDAPVANLTTNGTTYKYAILTSGQNYKIPTDGSIYIGPNAVGTTVYINHDFSSAIKVATNSAGSGSVAIYMDAPTFTISSAVDGGRAQNLSYYGTTNNTKVTSSGNGTFTGTIYAPSAMFKLNGGGSDVLDIIGGLVVRAMDSNGHFNLHFDESLRTTSPPRGYEATSWAEIY